MSQDPHEQTLGWIRQLVAIERPSASPGERRAADWIADRLSESGAPARVEAERAHGTHLPFVLPSALALLGGFVRSRPVSVAMAALAAVAIVDELEGRRRLVRRALARRETYNVVAETGDSHGSHTIVFVAHHDAARPWAAAFGAMVSAPPQPLLGGRRLPIARTLAYAPLTVLAGAAGHVRAVRRAGMALCAFVVALFADIARRSPVPGANDNASGVAALLGVASDLAGSPPASVRVVLLSAGSEETMLEGMDAFLRRHHDELDPARTIVVCLDQVGWGRLLLCESEGVLRRHGTRPEDVDLVLRAARAAGVRIEVASAFVSPSDGLAARWAGLPTIFISSAAADGSYPNYHRPSDLPEKVDLATVVAARRLCTRLVDEVGSALTSRADGAP